MTDPILPQPGIYEIACAKNGRVYIGRSVNVRTRILNHLSKLRRGTHANKHLQNAWLKYGPDAFTWRALLYVPVEQLKEAEALFISLVHEPFNQTPGGEDAYWLHKTFAPDHGARISAAKLGHEVTAATRSRISKTLRGRKHSSRRVANVVEATKRTLRVTFPDGHTEVHRGIGETAAALGIHPHSIQNSLKQKRTVCGGFLFEKIKPLASQA